MRKLAAVFGMAELALANVHPCGQFSTVGFAIGCWKVADAGIVVRLDTVLACNVSVAILHERTACHEPTQPLFDVCG